MAAIRVINTSPHASHNPDDQSISGYLECDAENGPQVL
jgi:hypothetical protein